jgi:voltage-gated potassium channel
MDALSRRDLRRVVIRTAVRIVVTTALLFVLYALAPVDVRAPTSTVARLLAVLVIVGVLVAWQVRAILAATHPEVRALEAAVSAITVFIILFALLYLGLAEANAASFNQHLDRIRALYFTVSVLSTVGFGDITAQTDPARLVVTIQMLLDLILIAVIVRAFFAAARAGARGRRDTPSPEDGG